MIPQEKPSLNEEIRRLAKLYGVSACQRSLAEIQCENDGDNDETKAPELTNAQSFGDDNCCVIDKAGLLDASFDGMLAVDERGIIRYANRAAVEQFGFDCAEDVVGLTAQALVGGWGRQREMTDHRPFRSRWEENFRTTREQYLSGDEYYRRQTYGRRRSGTEFPCVVNIEVLENKIGNKDDCGDDNSKSNTNDGGTGGGGGGKLYGACIRDVTRDNEARIKSALMHATFDAVFEVDVQGIIRNVNQAAIRMFDYFAENKLIGQNIKCVVGGGHGEYHDEYLRTYRETGETYIIGVAREVLAKRRDGSELPVKLRIQPVHSGCCVGGGGGAGNDSNGQQDGMFVACLQDVTKAKQVRELQRGSVRLMQQSALLQEKTVHEQQKLAQEEKMKFAILDAAFDAMFAVDINGIIATVNRAAVQIFGYSEESDLVGSDIKLILGGGQVEFKFHEMYSKSFHEKNRCSTGTGGGGVNGGETQRKGKMRELEARRKDGRKLPVMVGVERVEQDRGHPYFVAFVRDITEERKAKQLEIDVNSAEVLLQNMLPEEIVERLRADPSHLADHHENASILFADIVGFTAMSSKMTPVQLVNILNELFTRFDNLVDDYELNKVKTIGDCYMVTSIPTRTDGKDGCTAICHFAFEMMQALRQFNVEHPDNALDLRVGVNVGPVVAGVVGKFRFMYDLWGDAVNIASRMESTGLPSKIQVTKDVVDFLPPEEFRVESRGEIEVKGKGMMETFFLEECLRPRQHPKGLVALHRGSSKKGEEDFGGGTSRHRPHRSSRHSSSRHSSLYAISSRARELRGSSARLSDSQNIILELMKFSELEEEYCSSP